MIDLAAGIYKHYTGGLYLLVGVAGHSVSGDRLVVLVPIGVSAGPALTAVPVDAFLESVTVGGVEKPCFIHIGTETGKVFANFYDPLSGYHGADRVDS